MIDNLIEILFEEYDIDEYLNDGYPVLENMQTSFILEESRRYTSKYIEGSVYLVPFFPYYNVPKNEGGIDINRGKDRRVVVIKDKEYGYIAIRCSKITPKMEPWKDTLYKYRIRSYSTANCFTLAPYASIDNARSVETLNLNNMKMRGVIDKTDVVEIKKRFRRFIERRDTLPVLILEWLKMIEAKTDRSFKEYIQDARSVDSSKRCNSIDIANIVHCGCVITGIEHSIVIISLKTSKEVIYHGFCVFKQRNEQWVAFRYNSDKDDIKGDIITYNGKSKDEVIKYESEAIANHVYHINRINNYHILGYDEMLRFDKLVKEKKALDMKFIIS